MDFQGTKVSVKKVWGLNVKTELQNNSENSKIVFVLQENSKREQMVIVI